MLLGGAGTWFECYGFSEADWDFTAGGELCDSAGRAGCPRERIAIGTKIETYEFMDVPQFPPKSTIRTIAAIEVSIFNVPKSFSIGIDLLLDWFFKTYLLGIFLISDSRSPPFRPYAFMGCTLRAKLWGKVLPLLFLLAP